MKRPREGAELLGEVPPAGDGTDPADVQVVHAVHVLDTSAHEAAHLCPCGPHPARDIERPDRHVWLHMNWRPYEAEADPLVTADAVTRTQGHGRDFPGLGKA